MFDDKEAEALFRFLLKVILNVALIASSPFLMLAFLFFLLEKPLLWSLIPLGVAGLLIVAALIVWLVVRSKLRALQRELAPFIEVDGFEPPIG